MRRAAEDSHIHWSTAVGQGSSCGLGRINTHCARLQKERGFKPQLAVHIVLKQSCSLATSIHANPCLTLFGQQGILGTLTVRFGITMCMWQQ